MKQLPMNLQYFAGEKTEKATPQKKKEARKKGQVAKTAELSSAIIFLLSFLLFYLSGPYLSKHILNIYRKFFNQYLLYDVTIDNIRPLFLGILSDLIWAILPIFAITLIGGLTGNLMQIGFMFISEPLKIKLDRLNPLEGAKRIFSKRALVDLLKSIFKIIVVGYTTYAVLWDNREKLLSLYQFDLNGIVSIIGKLMLEIGLKSSVLFIVLSIFDYVYQRYDYEKNLRMSKQEIKEEFKKSEGDPLIKGKIKERQRQMAMSRMMQAIPEADVVITNPTHFAVAISYKPNEMEAPKVVAKGMDYLALKIKEVAKEHDIAIVENKWLARSLYYQLEIDDFIPTELYQAVAEVLAYVYRIKGVAKVK
ncbi:flagellar biosynthesis protein FlhB [Tepidibacillus fermentans]|uniref:Flagellar biosynthetic protein FlhB n=1 Tax=Tepidibacillus fermentans TaxID=1281767 RepID=A0A4R3KIF2_9BACI|nr:flagellar biosynthesis protein FlhB [Tepidibacillus fermentans]TCS82954.1 flagellar biosynthetic protein FlhB [Tepidibacillus fermentans]